jgi:ubiquinone/menaquinone biosynthesis C-methylase UbiE
MTDNQPPVCDYEGSDYQLTFWDQGDRSYEDQVEAIALRRLLPSQGERLLEIGAGAGRNTSRYHGFRSVVLLDYSRSQLHLAQQRLGNGDRYTYVAADAYRLPFAPGLFDGATMIRTIHHMANPLWALEQVRFALKPQGIFILEFANKQNLKAMLRYLTRRQTWSPFSPEPVEFAKLNFDFQPKAMRAWLRQSGFQIERQLTVSHFRIGFLKKVVPTSLLVNIDALAQLSGNLWQFTPSVFVRARAVEAEGFTQPAQTTQKHIFRCPECEYFPLKEQPDRLCCPACNRNYAIHDGIYDFREIISP